MQKTTRQGLQERQVTLLDLNISEESFNSTSLKTISNVNSLNENSKPLFYSGSGYNNRKVGSMSPEHNVFVLFCKGKPLTSTTPSKARKLMQGKQAVSVWNKFLQFGIKMLVSTRQDHLKIVLGVDFETKFEGYSVVTGKENNLAVMWKLPDKKKLVKKLEERKILRRARLFRNCRRREAQFNNRSRKDFIAPAQLQIIQSRLKCMSELFKCYPIGAVALEDVRFNHSKKKCGKNFSTVEIGKLRIKNWIRQQAHLHLFSGYDTQALREQYDYKKSGSKSAEIFNAHCSDALTIATDIYAQEHTEQGKFIVVNDTYRPVKRKLHDTQSAKGSIRAKYSTGNFKGVRKWTLCNHGQIVGGTKNSYWILNMDNHRIGRTNISWLSHNFKTKGGRQFLSEPSHRVSLPNTR